MMSRMRPIAVAVLTAAALGLAACGGSGDDEPAGPTRAEFIAKTDAQCKVSNARTKTLNEDAARVVDATPDEAQLLAKLAPIFERGYGQVRDNAAAFQAVNPPPADAAEIERIRKLYDEQAEIVRKLARAAKTGDVDQFKALSEEQRDVVRRARAAARAYGFEECGSDKSDAA
jgi:ABC-type Fe3+-hydroxamate transport system substrate-binding protein